MHFADSDVVVTETDSRVTTDARVEGDATGNLTVTIVPLTVGQYRADPNRYRNSCDRSIPANGNPAEGIIITAVIECDLISIWEWGGVVLH